MRNIWAAVACGGLLGACSALVPDSVPDAGLPAATTSSSGGIFEGSSQAATSNTGVTSGTSQATSEPGSSSTANASSAGGATSEATASSAAATSGTSQTSTSDVASSTMGTTSSASPASSVGTASSLVIMVSSSAATLESSSAANATSAIMGGSSSATTSSSAAATSGVMVDSSSAATSSMGHGSSSGLDCTVLTAKANEALARAQACNPAQLTTCSNIVEGLCCGTVINVSSDSDLGRAYLDALRAYNDAGCSAFCPRTPCFLPVPGICEAGTSDAVGKCAVRAAG